MTLPDAAKPAPYLTAAECARQTGVSVRALRLYEARGLIEPQRTAKNWRLYGARELARLSEILALRATSMTLAQIADLLSGQEADIQALLAMQEDRLRATLGQTERSLALVARLRDKLGRGDTLSVDELIALAKDTAMTDTDTHAWKRYEQMRPRTAVAADAASLPAYEGMFAFEDGMVAEITLEDDQLGLRLVGQPRALLYPESEDAFFLKVVPAQVTFTREGDRVTGMMLHQNGHEFAATLCAPERFAEAEAARKAHAARTAPLPESEAMLRRFLEEHRAGAPTYACMSEPLAQAVREQLPLASAELTRLGDVREVRFRRANEHGFDIFDVTFADGQLECGISFGPDGLVNGFYLRD